MGALGQEGAGPEGEKGQISGAHSQGQVLGATRASLPQPRLAPLSAPSVEITEFPSPGQSATTSLLSSEAQRVKGWGDRGPGCCRVYTRLPALCLLVTGTIPVVGHTLSPGPLVPS